MIKEIVVSIVDTCFTNTEPETVKDSIKEKGMLEVESCFSAESSKMGYPILL